MRVTALEILIRRMNASVLLIKAIGGGLECFADSARLALQVGY